MFEDEVKETLIMCWSRWSSALPFESKWAYFKYSDCNIATSWHCCDMSLKPKKSTFLFLTYWFSLSVVTLMLCCFDQSSTYSLSRSPQPWECWSWIHNACRSSFRCTWKWKTWYQEILWKLQWRDNRYVPSIFWWWNHGKHVTNYGLILSLMSQCLRRK